MSICKYKILNMYALILSDLYDPIFMRQPAINKYLFFTAQTERMNTTIDKYEILCNSSVQNLKYPLKYEILLRSVYILELCINREASALVEHVSS